jgi:hypothetical protein
MLKKLFFIGTFFMSVAAYAITDGEFSCAAEIESYVKAEFAIEMLGEEKQQIASVMIVSSEYQAASGEMDIEVYALYDEEGYLARRIFIGSAAELDAEYKVKSCSHFYTKASYIDPLAE